VAGVRPLRPELADKHGNLNREQLCIGRPPFTKACDVGLKFNFFHWQSAFCWPDPANFAQGALNVDIAKGQGEWNCY
jgi:hypothetical protein